jgi:hypothetical protein
MNQQQTSSTPTNNPATTAYHWLMTVQTNDGRQGTNDGIVQVTPGIDTRQSTYVEVLRAMREWIGMNSITVLFFSLEPNTINAPILEGDL